MPITYKNQKDDIYHIHEGKTKTGKPKWFLSTKQDGKMMDYIPEGYEIHESPDGRVSLIRTFISLFTDDEIHIIKHFFDKGTNKRSYKVDVKKEGIVVFRSNQSIDECRKIIQDFRPFFIRESKLEENIKKFLTYSPWLRFVKRKNDSRIMLEKWDLSGFEARWTLIEIADNLTGVAKRYSN